jgi:hypothetical protein
MKDQKPVIKVCLLDVFAVSAGASCKLPLTKPMVAHWMKSTRDYNGRLPTAETTSPVWNYNSYTGKYNVVEGVTGKKLNTNLRNGCKGGATLVSLSTIKKEYGLYEILTPALMLRRMLATRDAEGHLPNNQSKTVWDRSPETGELGIVKGDTWVAYDVYCRKKMRGYEGPNSLSLIKKEAGLPYGQEENRVQKPALKSVLKSKALPSRALRQAKKPENDNALFVQKAFNDNAQQQPAMIEETVWSMMQATHAKTGKWPTTADKAVYKFYKETRIAILQPRLYWHKINSACQEAGIGSLREVRKRNKVFNKRPGRQAAHQASGRKP